MKTSKILKSLFVLMTIFLSLQSKADVPRVDAFTRQLQVQFAAGSLPKEADLKKRYEWTCNEYSAVPNETRITMGSSVDSYNTFGGYITSYNLYKNATASINRAWAESSDKKSLEFMDTRVVDSDQVNGQTELVYSPRYFDIRVYKGHLIIEISVDVPPGRQTLYGQSLVLFEHAASNPDRALALYTVCP